MGFSEFEFGIERSAPGSGERIEEILREAACIEGQIAAPRERKVV